MASFHLKLSGFGLALGVLAGCVVVEEGGPYPPGPPPGPRPQVCPQIYAPVCGIRGRDRETLPNQCTAEARGFRVIYGGECRGGRPDRPDRPPITYPPGPRPPIDDDRPQFCTREYRPVCARRGRVERTFGNECSARAEGFRVVAGGECR